MFALLIHFRRARCKTHRMGEIVARKTHAIVSNDVGENTLSSIHSLFALQTSFKGA